MSLEITETEDFRITLDGQTTNISQLSVQEDTFSAEVGRNLFPAENHELWWWFR